MQFHSFPSIEQYRNTIRNVKDRARYVGRDENDAPVFDESRVVPVLAFRGTVKLHGTNAAVCYDVVNDAIYFQSRSRILTTEEDNAGFYAFMSSKHDLWRSVFRALLVDNPTADHIVVYGEWCGSGIQKGVAISQLPRMFVVFAVAILNGEGRHWVDIEPLNIFDIPNDQIYNICAFPTWEIEIDFNHPELVQNRLVELTEAVEARCPVGAALGVEGVGEGIVWNCVSPNWSSSKFTFKVKGEKYQTSKNKTLASVDVEAVTRLKDFVDNVVTEARLEQGLHHLINEQMKPFEMSSLGDFIRWVYNDVLKEESDVIAASNLDAKKLGGPIANAARPWYIQKLNQS